LYVWWESNFLEPYSLKGKFRSDQEQYLLRKYC
jgi:hypothetical protein